MRPDSDFAAYLVARWPVAVRTLALLGDGQPAAERVARTGFARCSGEWGRIRETHDMDAEVFRILLDARPGPGPDERRAVNVLHRVAGLTEEEVAAVLGLPVAEVEAALRKAGDELSGPRLRELAEEYDVLSPPVAEVLDEAREQRSRRRRRTLVVVAVVAAVVALATFLATRPDSSPKPLGPVQVQRLENPAPVAWWANGVLRLDHVALAVPSVRDLVVVPGGAVYGDASGEVVRVSEDGARTRLGTKVPGVPFRVAADGTVAWVEPGQEVPPTSLEQLSPDGAWVLTRSPSPEDPFGSVTVRSTTTGQEVESGLGADEVVLAARLGPGGQVTYVVARAGDRPQAGEYVRLSFAGPLELRTCSVATDSCAGGVKFPSTGATPVLAQATTG